MTLLWSWFGMAPYGEFVFSLLSALFFLRLGVWDDVMTDMTRMAFDSSEWNEMVSSFNT